MDYLSVLQKADTVAEPDLCAVVIAGPSGVGKGALLVATFPPMPAPCKEKRRKSK